MSSKTIGPKTASKNFDIPLNPEVSVAERPYLTEFLNLSKFPKNNSHFYLLHQIQDQLKDLKSQGKLIVFSAKKLFIPSQKDKIEGLLKQLKLECYLTLDQLKTHSNLNPYIYIFSRKKNHGHCFRGIPWCV